MIGKRSILAFIGLIFVLILQAYVPSKSLQRETFTDASGNTVASSVVGYKFWEDQNFWLVFAGMAVAFFFVLKVF